MMDRKRMVSKILASVLFLIPLCCQAQEASGSSLSEQATNPLADLTQLQLQNVFIPESFDSSESAYQFVVQPVVPLELPCGPVPLLIVRATIPIIRTTNIDASPIRRTMALGDITLLNVFVPKPLCWGLWGMGPVLIFPSASHDITGQGKWQAGPAAIVLYTGIKNWQLGALAYNVWSFSGDESRSDVNTFYFQPVANYHFGEGWYAGLGDMIWTFNWENNERNIPLSVRLGKTTELLGQNLNIFGEPFYTVSHDGPSAEYGFKVSFTFLFPK